MSIRPIDFNGMIQNTQGLSHTQAHEENRPLVQQELVQDAITEEVEVSATQVQEQDDASAESALDADREAQGGSYRGRRRKKNPKKKEKVSDGSVSVKKSHASFDMKI